MFTLIVITNYRFYNSCFLVYSIPSIYNDERSIRRVAVLQYRNSLVIVYIAQIIFIIPISLKTFTLHNFMK